jgi:phosphate transport system permease protein
MSAVTSRMPDQSTFERGLKGRQARGRRWEFFFLSAILVGLLVLLILLFSLVNNTFGFILVKETIPASTLSERPLEELTAPELAVILQNNLSKGQMLNMFIQTMLPADIERGRLATDPLDAILPTGAINPIEGQKTAVDLSAEELAALIGANVSQGQMVDTVYTMVVGRTVVQSWSLLDSLFNRPGIEQTIADRAQGIGLSPTLSAEKREEAQVNYAEGRLQWHSWLNGDLLTSPSNSVAGEWGIRQGLVGSVLVLLVAIVPSAIIGVGAAIYLEEYAKDPRIIRHKYLRWFNQFVETNIRNLAGVPSIIYGLLGLAIFARILEAFTSGRMIPGVEGSANGRTIISAGLTLGLLILPVIIINAQEAIRAVPNSIREASFGLGATRWQTISRQVLPASIPGIMTGIILSLSRAIGETAPLVVIGAAVSLSRDPTLFGAFTTLPIQIYNAASQPDAQFQNAASAAILILLALLLVLNATAIIIRQRFSRRTQ